MAVKQHCFLCAVIILCLFNNAFADWPVEHILLSADGEDDDKYGQSVSIDGNVCIVGAFGVGADKGVAEIHRFNGTDWVREQRISASDGAAWDRFGYSVSIDGDVCAVGAYAYEPNGAVYIFRYNGSSWVEEQKLIPSDAPFNFGQAIAIEGGMCLVGASSTLGTVYVFKYNGSSWTEAQKLSASDGEAQDQFGDAVSISGNICLIGMPNDNVNGTNTGSAYIFEYNDSSWVEDVKLSPAGTRDNWEQFGRSVSIDSDSRTCVIGAPGDSAAADGAGAVYVFDPINPANQGYIFHQKLMAPDATAEDAFGCSVSIDGDMCVVGSYLDDDSGGASGSAYIYKLTYGYYAPDWECAGKLTASDGEYQDYFGTSVAIDGNNVAVGAPAGYKEPSIGSAYISDISHVNCYRA